MSFRARDAQSTKIELEATVTIGAGYDSFTDSAAARQVLV